ncbi:hypothetical protein HDE69_002695 [Pedobacter cryoconitis]|uniref:Uncharacterized protein n=1 Tax=Pedobacter cryoconitis TaxID=188932 RepID=A0A7W8YTX9_9SPHI|nr:hypothetical protein [Pedobacter cryoconitis]MBB5644242.1 hypothetical protein [Pedobacter cryoconitis]
MVGLHLFLNVNLREILLPMPARIKPIIAKFKRFISSTGGDNN